MSLKIMPSVLSTLFIYFFSNNRFPMGNTAFVFYPLCASLFKRSWKHPCQRQTMESIKIVRWGQVIKTPIWRSNPQQIYLYIKKKRKLLQRYSAYTKQWCTWFSQPAIKCKAQLQCRIILINHGTDTAPKRTYAKLTETHQLTFYDGHFVLNDKSKAFMH